MHRDALLWWPLLLMSTVTAFFDFVEMTRGSAATHRQVHNGKVYIHHEVHQTFNGSTSPDHPDGTFFHVHYTAVHSQNLVFVNLNDHIDDVANAVSCSHIDDDHRVHVTAPPRSSFTKLLDPLLNGGVEISEGYHILVAHPRHHCGGEALFRRIVNHSRTVDPVSNHNLHALHTEPLSYADVFEDLDFHLDTNHLMHDNGVEHSDHGGSHRGESSRGVKTPEKHQAPQTSHVGLPRSKSPFTTLQWCSASCENSKEQPKRAVDRVLRKGAGAVAKVVSKTTAVAKNIEALSNPLGTYRSTVDEAIQKIAFNGDVTKVFQSWNIAGQIYIAGTFNLTAGVKFHMRILRFQLIEAHCWVYGNAAIGARASVGPTFHDIEDDDFITQINVDPISFSIGPTPVVVNPKIYMTGGYDFARDGDFELNAVLTAEGYIKQGFTYDINEGFQSVNERQLVYDRDLSPRRFKHEVGLVFFVQPDFELFMSFLGQAKVGMALYGEALYVNNAQCSLYLQMNAQVIVSTGAALDLLVSGHQVKKAVWAPRALVSYKTPIFRYCKPRNRPNSHGKRTQMKPLEDHVSVSGGDEDPDEIKSEDIGRITGPGTEPINDVTPSVTAVAHMNGNYSGSLWHGTSACRGSQHISLQVVGNFPNYTEVLFTLSSNVTVPLNVSSGGHELNNAQVLYAMEHEIKAGTSAALHTATGGGGEEMTPYVAADNETVAPAWVEPTMKLIVSGHDTRQITLSSPVLCGNVTLTAQPMSDDNTSFVIFASGGGVVNKTETVPSLLDRLKAKFKAVWAYAPSIAFVCLVGCAVGGYYYYRNVYQKRRDGASRSKNNHEFVENSVFRTAELDYSRRADVELLFLSSSSSSSSSCSSSSTSLGDLHAPRVSHTENERHDVL